MALAKVELGPAARHAAVRRLRGDDRHHLHVRRAQDRRARDGHRLRAAAIPGLYAAGELVGGIFYHNYPGGAGLMAGAVFGRLAGRSAAAASRKGAAR